MDTSGSIELISWEGANISFWLITLMVVVSAAFAAFSASIVRAAYSLFFTLFGMAGYYVLLGSGFLAVSQIIIYVGGILVLIMFGILLTSRPIQNLDPEGKRRYLFGTLAAVSLLFLVLLPVVCQTDWSLAVVAPIPETSVREVGGLLLDEYVVVLEAVGMTLLLCLFGAAYLVRRREH
jgi:NADH-quinone oxidoreductase subunit J